MEIGSIGYNYSHEKDYRIDRPNGIGCHLMLLVKSPAVFVINGVTYNVEKNSVVTLRPDTPCIYYGQTDEYTDDWIYFNLSKDGSSRFEELGIPLDKVIHLGNIDELSQLIHYISYEFFSAEEGSKDIIRHYAQIFLIKLGRLIKKSKAHTLMVSDRHSRFVQLRYNIYTMPDTIPDVGTLAKHMQMSRSGFQHTYRNIFGVNIMSDIINGRITLAKQLLGSTNLTVKSIAAKCGYSNEYCFMRQFKSHCGQTPTQFRSSL